MATYEELLPYVGLPVRIRGKDRARHLMPALLVALEKDRAVVRPFGRCRRDDVIALDDVNVWKSGAHRWRDQHGG